jgi:WD40-like Beta Propeller Repeat
MTNWTSSDIFEENIKRAFNVPAIHPEFVAHLNEELMQRAVSTRRKSWRILGLRPAWAISLVILLLLLLGTLVIGPQRVYAEFARLLGYIPGVGIVDESSPIRVLAEPVSVTRDGITITVTSATLTADKTQVDFRVFGVPGSAYPTSEDVHGCFSQPYLRLADGTQLIQVNFGYQSVPAGVNEAVFVIPCIDETLPGKAPENWELPLHFIAAPPDLTVMPVINLTPSPQIAQTQDNVTGTTPVLPEDSAVTVDQEIETSDGYILIGHFQPQTGSGESFQQTGMFKITDASGKNVSYTYPQDVNENVNLDSAGTPGTGWAAQFKAAGLTYPLTISFPGVLLEKAVPPATTEFTFDAGSDPQPGQTWNLNQDIQLAGHTLKVVSVTVDSRNGYSINFKVGSEVYSADVQIAGTTPNGGGGGGGGGLTNGTFESSFSYAKLPTGVLTVSVSNLILIGDSKTWQGQWSPATIRTDLPAHPTPQAGVCLTADSFAHLQGVPANLADDKILMYEALDDEKNHWGLVLYALDGSDRQVLAANAGGGTLSPDGSQMAYPAENGFHVMDLATQTEKVLTGVNGFDLHWSPDGKQIAYVGTSDNVIDSVFIVNSDGTQMSQVSEPSYESIIGWSPDSARLYFVVPYTGGAGWKVFSYTPASASTQELFTIDNGSYKALNAVLSPDGQWIAYRSQQLNNLYLVHPDGSDMHLVLDSPAQGIGDLAWSQSGWLAVSLLTDSDNNTTTILVRPGDCQAYLLPNLQGEVQGIFTP